MASIEDRWYHAKPGPDGEKIPKPRHGTGKRWKVHYTDPEGRQRSESFDKKADAERFKTNVGADVLRNQYIDPDAGRRRFKPYAESWLAAQTFDEVTRERTESRLRLHVYPVLGDREMGELERSPSIIQAWVRGMQASLEDSSAKIVFGNVSSIMLAAMDDGLIRRNPCRAGSVRPPRPEPKRVVPWTAERVAAVRAGMPGRYRAMSDCGSGLGMRQGEVFGFSPDDADWLRLNVHVCRQVRIVGGTLVFAPPKGGKERDVPLDESISLRLSAHLAEYPAREVTLPWRSPDGPPVTVRLMFTAPQGGAMWRSDWSRLIWHPALKAASVTPCRENGFHAERHYFASSLLADGVDIRTVSEYLGHHDPAFTLRIYTHLMPSGEQRARAAIARAHAPIAPTLPGAVKHGS
jgi:integrase